MLHGLWELLASALALEKEKTGTDDIKDRNRIMRAGTASLALQQQGKKRARDDVVSSGGAPQFRAPQSSTTAPTQQGYGQKKDVSCHRCGKMRHIQSQCRSAKPASRDSSGSII